MLEPNIDHKLDPNLPNNASSVLVQIKPASIAGDHQASNNVLLNLSEGECRVIAVEYLQLSIPKTIISSLFTLLTGGIFMICCLSSPNLFRRCFFSTVQSLQHCQYCYVANQDQTFDFQKIFQIPLQDFILSSSGIQFNNNNNGQNQNNGLINPDVYNIYFNNNNISENNGNLNKNNGNQKQQQQLNYENNNENKKIIKDNNKIDENYNINNNVNSQICYAFINRHQKYVLLPQIGCFSVIEYNLTQLTQRQISTSIGLTQTQQIDASRRLYGQCLIEFKIPNLFQFLGAEYIKPFQLILYLAIIIWFLEGNVLFSINNAWLSLLVNIVVYLFVRSSKKRLLQLAINETVVKILRPENGGTTRKLQEFKSRELLPGDIFMLQKGQTVPCDCVLIRGNVLVNESSMTGEVIPIPKFEISPNEELFNHQKCLSNILFDGSQIVNTMPAVLDSFNNIPTLNISNECVLAIAMRTGFSSIRGQIIRGLLYPQQMDSQFYREGIKFMFTLILFGLLGFFIALNYMQSIKMPLKLILFKLGDAFIYIMPPGLPIILSGCLIAGLFRLTFRHIYGQDPARLLLAGKVSEVCLDKTGTLTTDKIEPSFFMLRDLNQRLQREAVLDTSGNEQKKLFLRILACCHQAQIIDGNPIGDPIDLAGLAFSGWSYTQAEQGQSYLFTAASKNNSEKDEIVEILKIFEFHSAYQSMSVVIRERNNNIFSVFMKGSPEQIKNFCLPQTIPSNYDTVLNQLTINGFRVIALAQKTIQQDAQIQNLQRQQAEADMNFTGFLILENRLKKDTPEVVERLIKAGLNLKILSGDNQLTVVNAAGQAGIIDRQKQVVLFDFTGPNASESELFSTEALAQAISIKVLDIQDNLETVQKSNLDEYVDWLEVNILRNNQKQLSMSGNALSILHRLSYRNSRFHNLFTGLLSHTVCFGRCKPDHKVLVVKHLKQNLQSDQSTAFNKVAMVGDGANDCAAIREADIGVSFSQTDAAISAPFISTGTSLDCVERVLLEGRANISSSYEIFQFYLCSGFIRYIGMIIMSYNATNMNDFQNNIVAYPGNVIFVILWTWSRPVQNITNANVQFNLMSLSNALSMYGRLAICFAGQIATYFYLTKSSIYQGNFKLDADDNFVINCQENTVVVQTLTLLVVFQAFAIYTSAPMKEKLYMNYAFITILILNFLYNSINVIFPKIALKGMLFTELTTDFRIGLLCIIYAFGIASYIYESFIIKKYVRKL